jgi:hypothetical protein
MAEGENNGKTEYYVMRSLIIYNFYQILLR